jgi:hypothetical protein
MPPRSSARPLKPLHERARALVAALEAWSRGTDAPPPGFPVLAAAPLREAGLPALELARLARSLEAFAAWPARAARLVERAGAAPDLYRERVAALLVRAGRSLAEGVALLPADPDGAARAAADALAAANAVERERAESAKSGLDEPALASLRRGSLLQSYSRAADAAERAAADLASAAAACGCPPTERLS